MFSIIVDFFMHHDKLGHMILGAILTSVVLIVLTYFFGIKIGCLVSVFVGLVSGIIKELYDLITEEPTEEGSVTWTHEGSHFNIPDLISWIIPSPFMVGVVVLVLIVM